MMAEKGLDKGLDKEYDCGERSASHPAETIGETRRESEAVP